MELVYGVQAQPVLAGQFFDFPRVTGPGIFVAMAWVDPQTSPGLALRVRIMCTSDLTLPQGSHHITEDVNAAAETGYLGTGFQSAPVPLLDAQWSFVVRVNVATNADVGYAVLSL